MNALHLVEDRAQNRVQVEARSERPRQLVKDQQIVERNAIFSQLGHLWSIRGR